MTKHTPGPWRVARRPASDGAEVRAIASVAWCGTASSFGATETQVINADEAHANARLIAAAPELLAALEVLLDAKERGDHKDKAFRAARAAIAKARGET